MVGDISDTTETPAEGEPAYQTLADLSPVGIFYADAEGLCQFTNRRWTEMTGVDAARAGDEGWLDPLHPDDRDRVESEWRDAVRRHVPFRSIFRYRTSAGTITWVYGQSTPEIAEDGRVSGHVGTVTDITSQKETEAALGRYEQVIAASGDFIAFVDRDYRYQLVNDTYTKAFGKPRAEMVGKPVWELLGREYFQEHVRPQLDRCLAGESVVFEREFNFPAMGPRMVDVRMSPLTDGQDKVTGAVVTARDISERKRVERALRDAVKRYRMIVDTAQEGMWALDEHMTTSYVNHQMARMLGYTPQEMLGRSLFAFLDGTARMEAMRHWTRRRRGVNEQYDSRFKRSDGEDLWAIVSTSSLFDDAGEFRGVFYMVTDVTERTQAEFALGESEMKNRAILQALPDMTFRLSRAGEILEFYARRVDQLFPQRSQFIKRSIQEIMPPEVGRLYLDAVNRAFERAELQVFQYQLATADRTTQSFEARVTVSGEDEVLTVVRDVTEWQRTERELRESAQHFRTLYDDHPSMFFTVDEEGIILSVNRYGAEQLGHGVDGLTGNSLLDLFYVDDRHAAFDHIMGAFAEPDRVHTWELRKVRKNGTTLWVRETARVVTGARGRKHLLMVSEDITDARTLSEQLSYHATHDALTGLINRREFEQRLKRVLDTARRERSEHALCYLDLDQFKVINDTCGHVAGDDLLRQLGELLRGQVRKRDTLARLGGDEFGVLMEHCSQEQATRVANALRRAVEEFRFHWEDKTFTVGVSIGVVQITDATHSAPGVLSLADAACYAAKDEGRNRVHIYREDDAQVARRYGEMQWVTRINKALEEDRFHLSFQPITPVQPTGEEGEHYELLLRMEDEDGRMVPPGAFLPAAERYNLSTKLDRWVISTALGWLADHPEQLARLELCAINLSAHALADRDFLEFLVDTLERGPVPPNRLCFEVTEAVAISNLGSATEFMQRLRHLGCHFALDDFGRGLSSFSYLRNLPVDFLKIGGVFVRDIVDDIVDLALVKSINEMCHVLGKKTIAGCVENGRILAKLREIGVDSVQGYEISHPQPIAEKA